MLRVGRTARVRLGRSKETAFAAVLLASFVGFATTWFKGGGMEYSKMLWELPSLMSAYALVLENRPGSAEEEDSRADLEPA